MRSPDPSRRRPRGLRFLLAAAALATPAVPALALSQVSGPVLIGPSTAKGDPQRHAAQLSTNILNLGGTPDRLINVACSNVGSATLLDGSLHDQTMVPTNDQRAAARQEEQQNPNHVRQNGLDIPAAVGGGGGHPVVAQIAVADARIPVTNGALLPCSLFFAHAGQRIVVFEMGAQETPTAEP
jgi:hypothetical protein